MNGRLARGRRFVAAAFPASVVPAVLLAAALACVGATESWQEIKAGARQITSIHADFVQEKHMPILARPLVSTGTLDYRAPDSLRWEYRTPIRSILLMYGGRVRRYFQVDGRLTEDAGLNAQAFNVVVQQITQWLNGEFDRNPAFRARLAPGPRIILEPRDKAFAAMIRRIEVVLADRPGIIRSVTIYEPGDAFTRLVFRNITVNQAIDDAVFREVE